jgi:hypothetical protein
MLKNVIFRLAQEGALMTIPFLGDRVIRVTKNDLEIILSFSDFDNPPSLSLLEKETQEKFNEVNLILISISPKNSSLDIYVHYSGPVNKCSITLYYFSLNGVRSRELASKADALLTHDLPSTHNSNSKFIRYLCTGF